MLKIGIEDVDGELLKGGGGIAKNDKASLTAKDSPISSANKPINGQGMSAAARVWEKHAGREGEMFEPLKGNVAQRMNLRFSELQKSLERAKGIELTVVPIVNHLILKHRRIPRVTWEVTANRPLWSISSDVELTTDRRLNRLTKGDSEIYLATSLLNSFLILNTVALPHPASLAIWSALKSPRPNSFTTSVLNWSSF